MTATEFRRLALSFPEAIEGSHMSHPDFRIRGKIFATLGPGEKWGVAMLKPDQQAAFVQVRPQMFEPVNGAWGRRGATRVRLEHATKTLARDALELAWRNKAPRQLVEELDAS
jgi:hypothetical protein